jgi:glutamate-1-semialdehyde 2,1-aminomutase
MSQDSNQGKWLERAARVLPAGGFGNFAPDIVIREGHGSHVIDEDGNEFIDYLIGSGPMMVGHAHPEVNEAVISQLSRGSSFFANNAAGIELAEIICEAVPCADQLRFVSTGSEADMYAMRLARAHTGRDKILKFEGGYHGMSGEALMSLSPQRLENYPGAVPDSAGIPQTVRDSVVVAPFNDIELARSLISEFAADLAAVIVEPLQRLIPPAPGFLEALREETARRGIVLIFDEVVTGFRLSYNSAQSLYGVTPDLATFGKVIGGGFPMAAIAGHADIMAHFDKARVGSEKFTFQIGTLSGNPVAAVAGLKTLEILRRPGTYEAMENTGKRIMAALDSALDGAGIAAQIVGHPMLFDAVFSTVPVTNYRGVLQADTAAQARFNAHLRAAGILKPPSKFYICTQHDDNDVAQTIDAIEKSARLCAQRVPDERQGV